jgi:hypothetical protein
LTQEKFDAALGVHSLERQPCLITHLTNVASVLKLGARWFLVIADRRFGAAHYLPDSTLADALEPFAAGRSRHVARNLIASRLMATHDDAATNWAGLHGPDPRRPPADDPLREKIATLLDSLRAAPPRARRRPGISPPKAFNT